MDVRKFTRRRSWSIARTNLKVEVKVKGQRSRSPGTKNDIFGPFGGLQFLRFLFDRTSLGSSVKITFEELKDVSVTSGGRSYTAMLASRFDFEHRVFY